MKKENSHANEEKAQPSFFGLRSKKTQLFVRYPEISSLLKKKNSDMTSLPTHLIHLFSRCLWWRGKM